MAGLILHGCGDKLDEESPAPSPPPASTTPPTGEMKEAVEALSQRKADAVQAIKAAKSDKEKYTLSL